jgi:GAF domain-containing protein
MAPNFFEIGKRLLAESEVEKLLTVAMDIAIEMSGAERGMIILIDASGQILFETARNLKKEDIAHPEFEISRTIIDKVKAEKISVCLRNALADTA